MFPLLSREVKSIASNLRGMRYTCKGGKQSLTVTDMHLQGPQDRKSVV